MAGLATPALATLSTLNSLRGGVRDVRRLTGGRDDDDDAEAILAATQAQDLAQLQAGQAGDLAALQAANRSEAERIAAQAAETERQRRNALRRAVGRSRARLGGQGLSSADGSGEAILLGLIDDSAAEAGSSQRLDSLRLRTLAEREEAANRRNLLELSQLQERQRLERAVRGY